MNDPTNTLIYEIKNSLPPDSTLKHQVLFPGILLARYRLQGATCTVQHSSWPGLYIFSNGREGSMGWQLNSGKQIYLHRQAFACHAASACTQAIISLPNGFYEDLSLFFNLPVIKEQPPSLFEEAGLHPFQLLAACFPDESGEAFWQNDTELQRVISFFWDQPALLSNAYEKLKVLELLLHLSRFPLHKRQHLSAYPSEQVALVQKIHYDLLQKLDQRITIDTLAQQYLINQTTLKNVFKAVYGTSLAAHIKEHRLLQAAELLCHSQDSMAEIAAKVGYESQSRFSAAFKKRFGELPTQYRKTH